MVVLIFIVCFLSIQVVGNQEAVDIAKKTKDPQRAAKQLATEALKRDSKDDISCVVVRFKV
jgi:protein phosphatase 1L